MLAVNANVEPENVSELVLPLLILFEIVVDCNALLEFVLTNSDTVRPEQEISTNVGLAVDARFWLIDAVNVDPAKLKLQPLLFEIVVDCNALLEFKLTIVDAVNPEHVTSTNVGDPVLAKFCDIVTVKTVPVKLGRHPLPCTIEHGCKTLLAFTHLRFANPPNPDNVSWKNVGSALVRKS